MKIVKTTTPNEIENCKIVSHPSGDNPYTLVCMTDQAVADYGLEEDVVEDTSAFLSEFDLGGGEEEEM